MTTENKFKDKTTTYNVSLPDGSAMELQATPEFFEVIRKKMNLSIFEPVTDAHVRSFIWESCNEAFDKYEGAS
tara:strand:+ start:184 stop:402 length:219 start_codon:yes stop_codon:yes gene_type:complete